VEISMLEQGGEPRFLLYSYLKGKPLPPTTSKISVVVTRLGRAEQHISWITERDYLKSREIIAEPHSFAVNIVAEYGGKQHRFAYEQEEARIRMSDTQLRENGVSVNCIGSGSISVPGSDTQVIFNDGGALGADGGITYNKTADVMTLAGGSVVGNLGVEFNESDTNPTCAAGNYNIYADTSEAKLKMCQDGTSTDLDSGASRRKMALTEEFIGGGTGSGTAGQLGWYVSSDLGGGSISAGTAQNHPGYFRVNSGTTTNDRQRLYLGYTAYQDMTGGAWEAIFVFRLQGATTNVVAMAGFSTEFDYCGNASRDCIAIRYNSATDTNWQVRSYGDTTQQSGSPCDTGVAPNTTDWITFRLTGSGTSSITAGWRVNGGSESTCTVTLATPNNTAFYPIFAVQTTNTTAKQVDADFFSYTRTVTGR
jgi:hypothetical protein